MNIRSSKHSFQFGLCLAASLAAGAADYRPDRTRDLGFPVYTNQPAGRQLSGQHAAAGTPALSPAEAQRKFEAPPGFEVRLFAAEPEVVNPVAMTWDDRGRLWVVELYEYPLGAPKGEKPRDRIKILEDVDADGRADKVTVFADGLNLATGILLGGGGVYVGQAPDLLFLEDLDGDDREDRRTVLKTGFGLHDRHELLNGFIWGPDGYLYMTHGVFTFSKVKDPGAPDDDGVQMNAAVARFHPRSRKFEVFADGTSNPWGTAFDRAGNFFVSACVIDHFYHMAPGGIYERQGGTPENGHAYGLLPSIVDHKHKMAAYAGVEIYQGDQFPGDNVGTALMGNIHDNAIHQDTLAPLGSSFRASFRRDLVRANDGWFMPVSVQTGPDGAVWIMDWYDKYPCYQNANADPGGVDREHGRIWRVVHVGDRPGAPVPSRPSREMNLGKLPSRDLVQVLGEANSWRRRVAQRILTERRDPAVVAPLRSVLRSSGTRDARLAALWTLHAAGQLELLDLQSLVRDAEPSLRAWAARLIGERGDPSPESMEVLAALASDGDATVRLGVAVALRQFVSGALTVDRPVPASRAGAEVGPAFGSLVQASAKDADATLAFLIWMVAEPLVATDSAIALEWLTHNGPGALPLSAELTRKAVRRLCDTLQGDRVDAALDFIVGMAAQSPPLARAALDGLIEGQQGRATPPSEPPAGRLAKLVEQKDAGIAERAQRIGTLWGDAEAVRRVHLRILDASLGDPERSQAIQAVRQNKTEATRDALLQVVRSPATDGLRVEAIRALGEIGGEAIAEELIRAWKELGPGARRAAAETMILRGKWKVQFVEAVDRKQIAAGDVPVAVVRALSKEPEQAARERVARAFGAFRESDADKLKLIAAKRQMVIQGEPDLKAGHEVARKTCFVCHKLHGEGADVGPELTGVGRSSLDALLANVIDPNQIIGRGYENVEIETRDGRSLGGRVVENTDVRVRLLSSGPKEEVVAKADIVSMRVSEISVMPEGLEQMADADFRDLIWFILNPPGDGKPLNEQRRRELLGEVLSR
jgi:putative membrane-bound dehydrogenase-like protein